MVTHLGVIIAHIVNNYGNEVSVTPIANAKYSLSAKLLNLIARKNS